MPRRSAQQARADILAAAIEVFRTQGYAAATLEDVATSVRLTRGALLYHFRSKTDLLHALVEPLLADVDTMVTDLQHMPVVTDADRRGVLTVCADVLLRHRPVVELVVRDVATYGHVQERLSTANERIVQLLGGARADNDPTARVRAIATINLLTATVASRQHLTFDDPVERQALIDAATAAVGEPRCLTC